jgi:hypothetical protein
LRERAEAVVDVDFVMRRPLPELWKFSTAPVAPYISTNQPARPRLPGLPLGVRITPNWVSTYATLAQYLDYAWAQYNSRQGDPQAYFDAAADGAAKLGLRVVMGLNVEDCSGGGTASCMAAELTMYGSIAATHPGSCAFISWQHVETTWASADIRAAWDTLLAAAKGRVGRECRRA